MKTVYIVMHGERNEGGEVVAVLGSYESACKTALNVKTCFPGGWAHYDNNEWVNGCDFVKVEIWDVMEASK